MSKRNSLNFKLILGTLVKRGVLFSVDVATLIKTRLLITANSGGGKSWLLRLIAEGLAPHMPVHIIDPEGDFASLREKFNFVLVGKGGETPADPRTIEMVVHKLLELKASAVFDLYEMQPSARHEFVRLYARAMVNAPKHLWGPTAVIFDEAHLWCPEAGYGASVAKEEVLGFATRGRKRGFLSIFATQRLSNFSKDASSQLLNRIVGGTFEDVDLKRVNDLLSVESSERIAFRKEMQLLEPGLFYALGRALSRERVMFKSGDVQTTHESEAKYTSAPPPPPAHIKALLPQLADLPKEAEEKLETEKELRAKIRTLEQDLKTEKARIPTAPAKVTETKINVVDKLTRQEIKKLRETLDKACEIHKTAAATLTDTRNQAEALCVKLDNVMRSVQSQEHRRAEAQALAPTPKAALSPGHAPKMNPILPDSRPIVPVPAGLPKGDGTLGQCARACIAVFNQFREGCVMSKVALLAGYRVTGGLRNAMAELRGNGFIVGENTEVMTITGAGVEYCERNNLLAHTSFDSEQRIQYWMTHASMGECARKIIQILWTEKRAMAMQELADATGYKVTGGFRNATGALRTAGVIVGKNTEPMQLNPTLFS